MKAENGIFSNVKLQSRQAYVQKFTLVYSCVCLAFSLFFTPQEFNPRVAIPVNILLFLIAAPYWFRNTKASDVRLNVISQVSNALASIWICSFLGPTSHVNLIAVPQFILVLMMFEGRSRLLTSALGALCIFQLSLPLFPFVDTWYIEKRMKEENLVILRMFFDVTVLSLSTYQVKVIVNAWQDSMNEINREKLRVQHESEWRLRLLKILSHDIKEPMALSLQLIRKLEKSNLPVDLSVLRHIENSQVMIQDVIGNIQTYSSDHFDFNLPKTNLTVTDTLDKIGLWLKTRLDEKQIQLDIQGVDADHKLYVVSDLFIYQIFLNLISNTIKFSPHASQIVISTEMKNNKTRWILRDFGKGIALQNLTAEGISDPGTAGEVGAGLGIKIAKTFAKEQNISLSWLSAAEAGLDEKGTLVVIEQFSQTS